MVATIAAMDTWPTSDPPSNEASEDIWETTPGEQASAGPGESIGVELHAIGDDVAGVDIEVAEPDAIGGDVGAGGGDADIELERDAIEGGSDGDPDIEVAELDDIEGELVDVEIALERLADGSYGTCETCSRRIADDQLVRDPVARRCAEHLPLPVGEREPS